MTTSSERRALAAQLFGIDDASEAQLKMASRISEAILSDLIQHGQRAWRDDGPGVLVIRRTKDDARWSPLEMVEQNLRVAQQADDQNMAAAFQQTIAAISNLNIEQQVPIAIADHRGWRLLLLDATQPAAQVAALLESWNN